MLLNSDVLIFVNIIYNTITYNYSISNTNLDEYHVNYNHDTKFDKLELNYINLCKKKFYTCITITFLKFLNSAESIFAITTSTTVMLKICCLKMLDLFSKENEICFITFSMMNHTESREFINLQ